MVSLFCLRGRAIIALWILYPKIEKMQETKLPQTGVSRI
jgi:hypothetical protein